MSRKEHLIAGIAYLLACLVLLGTAWRFQVDLDPGVPIICMVMTFAAGISICFSLDHFGEVLDAS